MMSHQLAFNQLDVIHDVLAKFGGIPTPMFSIGEDGTLGIRIVNPDNDSERKAIVDRIGDVLLLPTEPRTSHGYYTRTNERVATDGEVRVYTELHAHCHNCGAPQ